MKRKKILFVCTGNTCRSPVAEALMRAEIKKRKIKWWDVASRGLNADVGGALSPNSALALEEQNVELTGFKPRQLTKEIIDKCALVITMTESQKNLLSGYGNVKSIKEICGYDVPDPYGCGLDIYRMTCNILKIACEKIIDDYILKYKE